MAAARPEAKPGAIPPRAGVLLRFAFEMQVGDVVIYPYKPDSTPNFGRVQGDYYWDPDASFHRSRCPVEWLHTGVPRARFSTSARYEMGAMITLFRAKDSAGEFAAFLSGEQPATDTEVAQQPPDAVEQAQEEPDAERIYEYTRDLVVETLLKQLGGHRFEEFVADLLEAMGYRTQVTPPSGDGGVDVIAHRDPLGLEPPIIKVQCKHQVDSVGAPDLQKLAGTLAPGTSELGLFVTLGAFSKEALNLGRNRQDLRLIGGNDLADLVFEHYEQLGPLWRRLLPLRKVCVIDRDPEQDA